MSITQTSGEITVCGSTLGSTAPLGRPLIIPLFIPHQGCPHHCVFCNQPLITGRRAAIPSPLEIGCEVSRFLKYPKKRPPTTQIAFFGGSFLGLEPSLIRSLLEAARPLVHQHKIDGIRFSTRPDTVSPETLSLLEGLPVGTVELGAQSMNDHVLALAGRGHQAADTVAAAGLLKNRGFQLGLQMMVGLPADDDDGAMETARRLAALRPDFVRIYPTLVLKGSPLARQFHGGHYRPLPLGPCVTLVKRLYLFFKAHHIAVVRMGLQASEGLTPADAVTAGPYHPAFGHLVHGEIALDAISAVLAGMEKPPDPLTITVNPRLVSRVQGMNKKNIHQLKRSYGLKQIDLVQNAELASGQLMVADHPLSLP